MPAKQTVDYGNKGYLDISIELIDEPESVYFTEDEPTFEFVMRNKTDRVIQGTSGSSGLRWEIELGPGVGAGRLASGEIELEIEPNGVQREMISPGLLAFEGNAVLGVMIGVADDVDEDSDEPIEFTFSGAMQVLYTFTIWDRSQYEAIHEHPKRLQEKVVSLQKWVIGLAGLTALLALIQVLQTAGVIGG